MTLFSVFCCSLFTRINSITSSVILLIWVFRAWLSGRSDPLIFSKCLGKEKSMLHVWPNNMLSRDITTSQYHNFTILVLFHHFSTAPLKYLTISPLNLYHCFINSHWYLVHYFMLPLDLPSPFFQIISTNKWNIFILKQCNCYHVCLYFYTFKSFIILQFWSKHKISECTKMDIMLKCLHLSVKYYTCKVRHYMAVILANIGCYVGRVIPCSLFHVAPWPSFPILPNYLN